MDRKSILDLLALIHTGSVTLAAQTRNCSQPSYSRRLQALESQLDAELVDRSKRPSGPTLRLRSQVLELEAALGALNRLADAFSIEPMQALRIAAQHSISANILPPVVAALGEIVSSQGIRLRSANQDACLQMLMSEEVVACLIYETPSQRVQTVSDVVERTPVGNDAFIPVCSAAYACTLARLRANNEPLPIITYPSGAFFGELTRASLLPQLDCKVSLKLVSGLTQAIQRSIGTGLGMGWLPAMAVRADILSGALIPLASQGFPTLQINLTLLRLRTKRFSEFKPTVEALCAETARFLRHDSTHDSTHDSAHDSAHDSTHDFSRSR